MRLLPDDGNPFDPAMANLSDQQRRRQASWPLAEIEFPFSYYIGGGLGSTEHENWRVVAWIAESEDVGRPQPGEWYGARLFTLEDCGVMVSGYCGRVSDFNFEIDSIREDVPPRKVDSALQPGQYIEESYGGYTMRCMEGPDSARSTGSYAVYIYSGGGPLTGLTTDHLLTGTVGVRDGEIQDCWMTDIDEDGKAEILVFSRSAGSGGYGELIVYRFDGTELQPAELPDPDPDLMGGYQGHDEYELADGKLVRGFPVYLEEDSNCCPQGGDRVIEFDSTTKSWKLSDSEMLR
jgi:hypothetical protein